VINFNSMLRISAAGSKYFSVVSLPVLFEPYDVAVIAILLGLERFISFVFSLESHGVFNRDIIQRTTDNIIANSHHLAVLLYGGVASICLAIFYAFAEGLVTLLIPIIIVGLSSGFMNELTRKAQAYGEVGAFSILSFMKSTVFVLAVAIIWSYDNVGYINLIIIWACVSIICVCISIYIYRRFFECDILIIQKAASDHKWLLSRVFSLRHFILLGFVTSGISLIERTIILNSYETIVLSSYFIIQSIISASLALFDIFLWGPYYKKIIERTANNSKFGPLLREIIFKLMATFALAVVVLVSILMLLAFSSSQYYEIITAHLNWLLPLSFLLILVPLDTFVIYYCHGRRLDNYNSWCGIFAVFSMSIFLFFHFPPSYLSGGLIIFYLVSLLSKLMLLRRDGLLS
jgi:hypothetical protein